MNPFLSQLFDLTGHTALVSGASSGLGQHFAHTLARAGARVALVARRIEKLTATGAEIESQGGTAFAIQADVTQRVSVVRALDEISERGGLVDIIVNNAGVSDTKRVLDYTDSDWDTTLDTNLRGAWIVAQESARRIIAAKGSGTIINVTSILATRVAGGLHPYAASKAGLKQLTHALALELAQYRIRVNSLAPGYIGTDMNRTFFATPAGDKLRSRIPLRSIGRPENLDGALLLLASEAGAHMTGAEVVVDGGHLCSAL